MILKRKKKKKVGWLNVQSPRLSLVWILKKKMYDGVTPQETCIGIKTIEIQSAQPFALRHTRNETVNVK